MAVKVMVAPAIASGGIEKSTRPARRAPDAAQAPKPKRRRSSVYDADGNEVFITLMCLKCKKMRPLSLFGLRRMADGAIRNQPWCRSCRSGTGEGTASRTCTAAWGAVFTRDGASITFTAISSPRGLVEPRCLRRTGARA